MCGIVGLFLKDPKLQPQPGTLLTDMLITMTDRGPDSAGIAIYSDTAPCRVKITAQSTDPAADFAHLDTDLQAALGQPVTLRLKDSHAVLELPLTHLAAARTALTQLRPQIEVISGGETIEIFKEVGLPGIEIARVWKPEPATIYFWER